MLTNIILANSVETIQISSPNATVVQRAPKMVDRALMAVDRGDDVDSVLMYALGTVAGRRAAAVREVLEG